MSTPLVALVGPTGSGKSRLAMQAALRIGAAIVAVDAFTVYREMDIGTAKPTPEDRRQVPHHMIDLLDVEQDCTVQWFQAQARATIERLRNDGTPILLVGGSGLYFRAVVDALEFPPTDPAVRVVVQAEVQADVPAAFTRLSEIDPDAAGRMDPLNSRRITRALEVHRLTGRRFSSYRTGWDAHQSIYENLTVIGTRCDRDVLHGRIADRTTRMMTAGWVEECRRLLSRDLSTTAAQAIGYGEISAWLKAGGSDELEPVMERISIRTRQFANRQRRWFAGDPRVQWIDPAAGAGALAYALRTSR